jgi:endonuclease/exonuclease/phosphatase family metal-dependent hydrolase
MGEYQIDHVFADASTEQRVTGSQVDLPVASGESPYSDHAPIIVTLGAPPNPVVLLDATAQAGR